MFFRDYPARPKKKYEEKPIFISSSFKIELIILNDYDYFGMKKVVQIIIPPAI